MSAVGYGFDAATNLDYVIVKNSWGASWGDSGYVKIATNADSSAGTCGLQSWVEVPNVE